MFYNLHCGHDSSPEYSLSSIENRITLITTLKTHLNLSVPPFAPPRVPTPVVDENFWSTTIYGKTLSLYLF